MFSCEFCEISNNNFFTEHLWVIASKQVTVPMQCLQTAKSLISSCRRTGETIMSNYLQNSKITATVHYFHYNSHHHYHYYHFHYHPKMHLYHLKILLTIFFIVKWSPVCFNWILSFYWYVFFFYYIILFIFLGPVKGVRISLRPSDIFCMFSLYF